MNNIYYSPEECGLKIFGEVQKEPDYDFDKFVIWERLSDHHLFYASDSGCSCPSPFEDYHSVDQLTPIFPATQLEFEHEIMSWNVRYDDVTHCPVAEINELLQKVRQHMRKIY